MNKKSAGNPYNNQLFNIYLKRMGSIPLLKREDEIEVARCISELGNDSEIAKTQLQGVFKDRFDSVLERNGKPLI